MSSEENFDGFSGRLGDTMWVEIANKQCENCRYSNIGVSTIN